MVRPMARRTAAALLARPAAVFTVLSLLLGLTTTVVTPPLRAPDEPAHFLRIYGFARGEVLASAADEQGRKGLFLPGRLHEEFVFFADNRYRAGSAGFSYREVVTEYLQRRAARITERNATPPVFVLFEGSEGYSPAAYLPQLVAGFIAELGDFDFLARLYLMRLAGLVAMTAVAAYAIAVLPYGQWAFVLIAMLPSALYARATISGDSAVLSYTMLVAALALAAASGATGGSARQRSLWMTLCVLSKPPQIAFVVLEAMTSPLKELRRRWRTLAVVVLPGLVLLPLWILTVSGEMGAWRMIEGYKLPPEQFQPLWKLQYMLQHPLHFPTQLLASFGRMPDAWRELIGVLGWRDTHLHGWGYAGLTLTLALACWNRLPLDRSTRARVAVVSALAIVSYILALYLIFYLSWTPVAAYEVEGVQGRYFIGILPSLALLIASLLPWELPRPAVAAAAIGGALSSGVATIEAILRFDW